MIDQPKIIDGKLIAGKIKERLASEVKKLTFVPKLLAIQVGENAASESFLKIKKKFGEGMGVSVEVLHLPENSTEDELVERIKQANEDSSVNGIVVQLPLPSSLDTEKVLSHISPEKDPDALSPNPKVHSPVAAAVEEILEINKVALVGKKVLVVGEGRLVGKPVIKWFRAKGVEPLVIGKENWQADSSLEALASADIIISGVGTPHLIKTEMIKSGVVLIDAGTSEQASKISGDIDPSCSDKASLFTPVPGGVGPIAVAMLYKNLMSLIPRES